MNMELDIFLNNSIKLLKNNHKFFPKSRIMRLETFNLIQETLEKYTGKAALLLLFRFGELNADIMLNNKNFINKNLKELIENTIVFGSNHKWFDLNNIKFKKNYIVIRFNSTFQSKKHLKVDYTVCSFIEGLIKKISNNTKEKNICICEETKCLAKGDDFCEFKIKSI
jgi:predicted hydrocarbon binding protein